MNRQAFQIQIQLKIFQPASPNHSRIFQKPHSSQHRRFGAKREMFSMGRASPQRKDWIIAYYLNFRKWHFVFRYDVLLFCFGTNCLRSDKKNSECTRVTQNDERLWMLHPGSLDVVLLMLLDGFMRITVEPCWNTRFGPFLNKLKGFH